MRSPSSSTWLLACARVSNLATHSLVFLRQGMLQVWVAAHQSSHVKCGGSARRRQGRDEVDP